jgi:hypothetical protein
MNKPAGWSLFHLSKEKCGVCGMHKGNSKGCCKDEHKAVKFTSDQKASDNNVAKVQQLGQAFLLTIVYYSSALVQLQFREHSDLSPPHLRSVLAFIYNCNFRI